MAPGTGLGTSLPTIRDHGAPGCCRGLGFSFLKPWPLALLAKDTTPGPSMGLFSVVLSLVYSVSLLGWDVYPCRLSADGG